MHFSHSVAKRISGILALQSFCRKWGVWECTNKFHLVVPDLRRWNSRVQMFFDTAWLQSMYYFVFFVKEHRNSRQLQLLEYDTLQQFQHLLQKRERHWKTGFFVAVAASFSGSSFFGPKLFQVSNSVVRLARGCVSRQYYRMWAL